MPETAYSTRDHERKVGGDDHSNSKRGRSPDGQQYQVPLRLVLIDTVSRAAAFPASGENDPSQCQALMSALTTISLETNTFVFGLDHMGKDVSKGTRGGSPKEDYADVVLSLVGRNRVSEMQVTKVSGNAANFVIPSNYQSRR